MGEQASDKSTAAIDVDLVAAQFDVLDDDTRKQALHEAIRSRDAYRKLIEELQAENEKLKLGLIGPKTQRFKGENDSQLSLAVLAELLGEQDIEGIEGADAKELAAQLAEKAEAEALAGAGDGGDGDGEEDGDEGAHRKKRKRTGRKAAKELPKVRLEILHSWWIPTNGFRAERHSREAPPATTTRRHRSLGKGRRSQPCGCTAGGNIEDPASSASGSMARFWRVSRRRPNNTIVEYRSSANMR